MISSSFFKCTEHVSSLHRLAQACWRQRPHLPTIRPRTRRTKRTRKTKRTKAAVPARKKRQRRRTKTRSLSSSSRTTHQAYVAAPPGEWPNLSLHGVGHGFVNARSCSPKPKDVVRADRGSLGKTGLPFAHDKGAETLSAGCLRDLHHRT